MDLELSLEMKEEECSRNAPAISANAGARIRLMFQGLRPRRTPPRHPFIRHTGLGVCFLLNKLLKDPAIKKEKFEGNCGQKQKLKFISQSYLNYSAVAVFQGVAAVGQVDC